MNYNEYIDFLKKIDIAMAYIERNRVIEEIKEEMESDDEFEQYINEMSRRQAEVQKYYFRKNVRYTDYLDD